MALGVPQANNFGSPDEGFAGDSEFALDLSGVSETSGLIDEGQHLAKVINVQRTKTKNGDPMFVWEFEIVSGNNKGMKRKYYNPIMDSTMWSVAETMEALGLGKAGEKIAFTRTDALNRLATVTIAHEQYNGRPTANIKFVSPPPEGAGSKAAPTGVPT